VWAIHWPQGEGLELHDHGGSAGAVWVVHGALEEHYIRTDGSSARRDLVTEGGIAFGPGYVHDVVNPYESPATSLHVYSPPMASMTFYRQEGAQLFVDRADYRADPEWAP
jgi:predicted metal-dependent enzyme (double-stranded beta helix superfamily)